VTVVSSAGDEISKDLATNGVLRAAINLGNPVLAQGTPAAPAFVEDLKASGFIAAALQRAGQDAALVAPPAPRN